MYTCTANAGKLGYYTPKDITKVQNGLKHTYTVYIFQSSCTVLYIHIFFSAENNVNLYVQFSNCSRPILAMYQKLCMWDRKF